jgi:N-acetyl-gamma-glutamyl-phosphate reductase
LTIQETIMYKTAILGAAGYAGVELLRILRKHRQIEVTVITSDTFKNRKLHEVYPEFRGAYDLSFETADIDQILNRCEAAFLALPADASLKHAEKFVKAGKIVVDLSGAFRLKDRDLYRTWYKLDHQSPELLKTAVYGLPELFREDISASRFVSNPGCYPTGIALGLAPVVERKLVSLSPVIIDAKSGISGKGRKADVSSLFCELNENMYPYKAGTHQHTPEIEQTVCRIAKTKKADIVFVPQVVPLDRGILSNIYCSLEKDLGIAEIEGVFREFYQNEQFVRVLEPGVTPQLKAVARTNFCDIGLAKIGRTLVVMTAIDNMVKGAAGQAVQNFNIMTGVPEEEGLR